MRTRPGHCPKCGAHIGRAMRAHAKFCDGTPPLDKSEPERETDGRWRPRWYPDLDFVVGT